MRLNCDHCGDVVFARFRAPWICSECLATEIYENAKARHAARYVTLALVLPAFGLVFALAAFCGAVESHERADASASGDLPAVSRPQ